MSVTGSILLDTNIVVAHFRNETSVSSKLGQQTLYLPLVALAELYYGAYKSSYPTKTLAGVHGFLKYAAVLSPGEVTADFYGRIKADLEKAGTPIPQNDIWIAAIAMEHQLPLASRDRHFSLVKGLTVLSW